MGFLRKIGLVLSFGDRLFLAIALLILICLLWLKFIEQTLPLWVGFLISVILAVIIVKWG